MREEKRSARTFNQGRKVTQFNSVFLGKIKAKLLESKNEPKYF